MLSLRPGRVFSPIQNLFTILTVATAQSQFSTSSGNSAPSIMSWLWTFGSVPELQAPEVQKLSERISAMTPEERADPSSPRIIDVRTQGEYDEGHVAGALNASFLPPWSFSSRIQPLLSGLNPDTPLICICLSAHRSVGAVKWLRGQGYSNVTQLAKGMQDWRARKLPEVK